MNGRLARTGESIGEIANSRVARCRRRQQACKRQSGAGQFPGRATERIAQYRMPVAPGFEQEPAAALREPCALCTSAESIASRRCAPWLQLRIAMVSHERGSGEPGADDPEARRRSLPTGAIHVLGRNAGGGTLLWGSGIRSICAVTCRMATGRSGAWPAGAHRAAWIHDPDRPAPMLPVDAEYLGLLTHRSPPGSNDLIESIVSSVSMDPRTCPAVSGQQSTGRLLTTAAGAVDVRASVVNRVFRGKQPFERVYRRVPSCSREMIRYA